MRETAVSELRRGDIFVFLEEAPRGEMDFDARMQFYASEGRRIYCLRGRESLPNRGKSIIPKSAYEKQRARSILIVLVPFLSKQQVRMRVQKSKRVMVFETMAEARRHMLLESV